MTFHFAWVDPGQTTFSAALAREDEQVLSFEIRHDEGDFASLRIEVRNPRVGLLAIGRKRWAWLAHTEGAVTTPLFFGRLVGLPEEMSEDVVTLSFIAKPQNYQAVKEALADAMRELPYYDPLFIEKERRDDPDTVLEARPRVWCIDRVTHELTASHILIGEAGMIDFGGNAFEDSVKCSFTGPAQRKVILEATVSWTQRSHGRVAVTFDHIRTYTGDGLLSAWPQAGNSVGRGWTVRKAYARDLYSSRNSRNIKDDDGNTVYRLYQWDITGDVEFGYDAERRYSEVVKLKMSSSLQEMVTEAGDEAKIHMSVRGEADEPVDEGRKMPIRDLRRRAYFVTDRGARSVAYLANIASARLMASARCVDISFEVPFTYATRLSLRHSGSLVDPRLPGGQASGKIKSYTILADGASGRTGCSVTLGCTPGHGETLVPQAGAGTYTGTDYLGTDYMSGYQVHDGAEVTVVEGADGSPAMTISTDDQTAINDDGLDLLTMTERTCVLDKTITNSASGQVDCIFPDPQDTYNALTEKATTLAVRLRPVDGGPFETRYMVTSSPLVLPRTIDLEAPSA